MSGLSLGMVVEGLVAMLLLLTIGYCVTLNRRLQRLHADEEMLRATISELITATEIAERAILGLKATANDCEKNISSRLAEAGHASSRLSDQVAAGEGVFQKIAQIAGAARGLSTIPAAPQSSGAYRERGPGPQNVTQAPPQTFPAAEFKAEGGNGLQSRAPSRNPADTDHDGPVRHPEPSVTSNLINAAEAAAIRVQNLRRMTGDQAA